MTSTDYETNKMKKTQTMTCDMRHQHQRQSTGTMRFHDNEQAVRSSKSHHYVAPFTHHQPQKGFVVGSRRPKIVQQRSCAGPDGYRRVADCKSPTQQVTGGERSASTGRLDHRHHQGYQQYFVNEQRRLMTPKQTKGNQRVMRNDVHGDYYHDDYNNCTSSSSDCSGNESITFESDECSVTESDTNQQHDKIDYYEHHSHWPLTPQPRDHVESRHQQYQVQHFASPQHPRGEAMAHRFNQNEKNFSQVGVGLLLFIFNKAIF